MLLDFNDALVPAPNPQLWVIPQELLKEIVGLWAERVSAFVLLKQLVLTRQDFFDSCSNLMGLRRQLVLVLQRVLATEHFKEKDAETEPIDRAAIVLIEHHLWSHVLESAAESCCSSQVIG